MSIIFTRLANSKRTKIPRDQFIVDYIDFRDNCLHPQLRGYCESLIITLVSPGILISTAGLTGATPHWLLGVYETLIASVNTTKDTRLECNQ